MISATGIISLWDTVMYRRLWPIVVTKYKCQVNNWLLHYTLKLLLLVFIKFQSCDLENFYSIWHKSTIHVLEISTIYRTSPLVILHKKLLIPWKMDYMCYLLSIIKT